MFVFSLLWRKAHLQIPPDDDTTLKTVKQPFEP